MKERGQKYVVWYRRSPIVGTRRSVLTLSLITAIIVLSLEATGLAQVIDFETIPGGDPTVELVISDQFEETYGVRFSVLGRYTLRIGGLRWRVPGLGGRQSANDVLAPGYDRGQFFAVYPEAQTPGRYLVIEYVVPTTAAAFDIIDIDDGPGNNPGKKEQWTIRVFDPSDSLLDVTVITAGDPGTGDAIPTRYSSNSRGPTALPALKSSTLGSVRRPGWPLTASALLRLRG